MYQALYRKYRPKNFHDVYGQDHVISTLKNEINENRISHAYLFTGSRGTGKTTCAKILAKAVNCENSQDGEPCNECEVCRGLDSGAIYDVVEIDAASNNGVDNIRDLREEANYTPSRGRYRVYIIDEVHMLSVGAFNALLKTLEEPPAHVIFILATTEVHKLPATILSRCQRFDFKRIQPETMAVRLKQVADIEGIALDDSAAVLIARIADGALRDGLSILDQCASRSNMVDSGLVSQVAGVAGKEVLHKLSSCITGKSSGDAIGIISELYANSYDMERLCVEMINHLRNFMIIKTVKKSRELILCTDDDYELYLESAKNFTLENLIYSLDLLQSALTRIKSGANSRIEMEMSFIRLCEPRLEQTNEALLDRISTLENIVKRGVPVQTPTAPLKPQETAANEPKVQEKPIEHKQEQEPAVQMQEDVRMPEESIAASQPVMPQAEQSHSSAPYEFEHWAEFMDIIYKTDIVLYGVLNGASASINGDFFVMDSPNPTIKDIIKIPTHKKAIRQAVFDLTGLPLKLAVAKKDSNSEQKRDLLEDFINKAQNNIKINFE